MLVAAQFANTLAEAEPPVRKQQTLRTKCEFGCLLPVAVAVAMAAAAAAAVAVQA